MGQSIVTREMIGIEIRRWKRRPKATRGLLHDHVRAFLEVNIPPQERQVVRGSETFDMVDYILEDLGSYGENPHS